MGAHIESFRDLIAWQKTFSLGLEVYELTRGFPDHERYGLTAQMRRASVSVPSNIAEGYGRESLADYVRFLKVARGSLFEVETQLLFSSKLGYISEEIQLAILDKLHECGRILNGLINSLKR